MYALGIITGLLIAALIIAVESHTIKRTNKPLTSFVQPKGKPAAIVEPDNDPMQFLTRDV